MSQHLFSYVRLIPNYEPDLPLRELGAIVKAQFTTHLVTDVTTLTDVIIDMTPDLDPPEAQQLSDLVEAQRIPGTAVERHTYTRNLTGTGYDLTARALRERILADLGAIEVSVRAEATVALVEVVVPLDAGQLVLLNAAVAAVRAAGRPTTPPAPISIAVSLVAELQDPLTFGSGAIIVSDVAGAGGPVLAFSDGTDWRRADTNAVIPLP